MNSPFKKLAPKVIFVTWLIIGLSACTQVNYITESQANLSFQSDDRDSALSEDDTGDDDTGDDHIENVFDRMVVYKVERAFYDTIPTCTIIAPIKSPALNANASRLIERSINRYLSERIGQVISANQVKTALGKYALDLNRQSDRLALSKKFRCSTLVNAETNGIVQTYAFVWAQKQLALRLTMRRIHDGALLWRATHRTSRSEGGLPMGFLSFPINAFQANRFSQDSDSLPSIIDDVTRRMLASLPKIQKLP